jgi:hypothetical protein
MNIDASLYPERDDVPVPTSLDERADYVQRVCAAWDFGIAPEERTLEMLRGWKDAFDAFPLHRSPGYHAFRSLFGWDPVVRMAPLMEQRWERMDALAQRPEDDSPV